MNLESFPCQLVTWNDAFWLARDLAKTIKSSGYHPDLVIAVGRGGFVPARIVCDFMLHNQLTSIKIEHWGIAAHKQDTAKVRFPLSTSVDGLKVLIVDDVTDTGETLKVAASHVKGKEAADIRTGVLQHKVTSLFKPDYAADLIKEWKWIIYPWAAHEDLVGFVERVLSQEPISKDQIRSELERRYDLVINQQIPEILQDLVEMGKAEKRGNKYIGVSSQAGKQ
jgi:hypoxanthine phosphoribosyltransferase